MAPPAILKGRIYQVILERGPMLYEVLAQYLPDVDADRLKSCIQEDRRKPQEKRVFRVVEWKRNLGKRGLPSPIIGIGNEPDAPEPNLKQARKEAIDRYNREIALTRPQQRLSKKERDVLRDQNRIARAIKHHEEEVVEKRAANVFANILAPATPIEIKGTRKRQFRTSNQEPKTNATPKSHVSEDPYPAGKRGPFVAHRSSPKAE